MTTACIVQARLRSSRLPAKTLLVLPNGRTVIEEMMRRCRQIPGVDVVVAAVADDFGSSLLIPFIEREQDWTSPVVNRNAPGMVPLEIVVGPQDDVIARYLAAAEAVRADVILRVTSDCPMIDPDICGKVIAARAETGAEYACNNMPATFPHGLDCEAFTMDLLRQANEIGDEEYPENRQGVDVWMREAPGISRHNVTRQGPSQSHVRFTLDTIQDYEDICAEFIARAS
jgi:glutamate-1-semialdehyde 2,1-aminomutase/spore coat polysaccharide biosynthesis protein SpsF